MRLTRFAALALLLLPLGCSHCGSQPARNPEEFMASDAPFIVSVPSLGALADHVSALKATARAAGNNTVVEWLATIAGDGLIGFDPFTRAGQKQAGLDPDRALVIGGSTAKGGYAALPYTDLDRILAGVKRLGPDRQGANVVETRTVHDRKITVYTTAAAGKPAFSYTTQDGYLILGMGETSDEEVARAVSRRPEESAAKTGPFVKAKASVGDRDLYAYLPHIQGSMLRFLPGSVNAGVTIGDDEVAVRALFPMDPAQVGGFSRAFKSSPTPIAQLPAEQPIYLRGGLDWVAIAKTLADNPSLGAILQTARDTFKAAGLDLDKDVLENLQPGFAGSLGIAATAQLANAIQLDPRQQNPFENYSLVVLGHVKDSARTAAAFAKLPQAIQSIPTVGATINTHDLNGSPVYVAHYNLGDGLAWTLHGDEVIAAGGFGDRLDSVLKGLTQGGPVLTRDQFSKHAGEVMFGENGLALAIDFARLDEAVKKVPAGSGPGAYMARAVVNNGLKRVNHFRPVISVSSADGQMQVDFVTNVK